MAVWLTKSRLFDGLFALLLVALIGINVLLLV